MKAFEKGLKIVCNVAIDIRFQKFFFFLSEFKNDNVNVINNLTD
jgi:hypothetical protein